MVLFFCFFLNIPILPLNIIRCCKDYSEKTAAEIDDEVRRIISECYKRCESILTEHIDKLHFVAEFLLKNESMDEEQFRAAMETEDPTIEEIEDIAFKKKQKSEEENLTAHENNAKAEEEERLRREELSKRMAEGESLTDELLDDVFGKTHVDASGESEAEESSKEESADDSEKDETK